MTYTITNLKDAVAPNINGQDVASLTNFYTTAHRAALVLLGLDPKETQRITQISPQLFDGIDVYTSPSDFKAIIDLVPSTGRLAGSEYMDDFRRTGQVQFSQRRNKEAPLVSEQWNNGVRSLLIHGYPRTGRSIQLDGYDSTTGFSVGGDAGSLAANVLNYIQGSGSISIELSGATGSAYIEKTTLISQDLTDFNGLASWFKRVYIPSGYSSRFTAFSLFHGNDTSTNYWSKSVTAQHDGTAFRDGWNLLRFDWSSATQNGTVDEAAMDSVRLTMSYSVGTAIPGVLIDDFNVQLGTMYDLHYLSNMMFRTTLGVWKEIPTEDTDIINCSTDTWNIMVDLTTMFAMQELRGMEDDAKGIQERLGYPQKQDQPFAGSMGEYRRMFPSQRMTQTHIIHDFGV